MDTIITICVVKKRHTLCVLYDADMIANPVHVGTHTHTHTHTQKHTRAHAHARAGGPVWTAERETRGEGGLPPPQGRDCVYIVGDELFGVLTPQRTRRHSVFSFHRAHCDLFLFFSNVILFSALFYSVPCSIMALSWPGESQGVVRNPWGNFTSVVPFVKA